VSKRVAVLKVDRDTTFVLTEFSLDGDPYPQLQLSMFGKGTTQGAYARLSQKAARELATALENWLNGGEPAA
jgi:hypothetical protein